MNNTDIEKLWDQIYTSFEKRPFDSVRTLFGMKGSANQIQFRIMNNVALLKNEPPTKTLVGAIRADIMLAETMGIMPAKSAEQAQQQLDKIEEKSNGFKH